MGECKKRAVVPSSRVAVDTFAGRICESQHLTRLSRRTRQTSCILPTIVIWGRCTSLKRLHLGGNHGVNARLRRFWRNCRAVMSHILSKAEEWKWIDFRPIKVKRLKVEESRLIYLTADQAESLVQAATHDQNRHIYPFIVIGLETGMRKMEILKMKRANVDTDRRLVYIPEAKAGMREQPITSGLADYLKRYIDSLHDESEWLFPCSTSKTGHSVAIEKAFRRVVADAGLPSTICRHTLRHTAITHLVQSGVDLPTVARISGHRTLSMVAKYAHANGEHIQAATDKLERRYQHT
jgi:integrase